MSVSVNDDSDLLKSFKNGDENAFTIIMNRYKARLINAAFTFMHDKDEAQDIVQETFVKAYFKLKDFHENSALYTWLYKIMYNNCISRLRKKKMVSFFSKDEDTGEENKMMDFPSDGPSPYDEVERKSILNAVNGALEKLPTKQRMIFAMKQFDGLKHEEISQIIGISEGAVKASYFHAVNKMKELLKDYR
jgi:RNA polymerase sigma-70 factor, ECF subfamily